MSNKYQNALEAIIWRLTSQEEDLELRQNAKEDIAVLQELVDKETPKKVNIGKEDYSSLSKGVYDICCPCCEELLGFTDQNIIIPYCPFCGQKLEW